VLTVLAQLIIIAMPPGQAYDYEYFRARLADPLALEDAVALRVFKAPSWPCPSEAPAAAATCPSTSSRSP
jgi:hypothetical protein